VRTTAPLFAYLEIGRLAAGLTIPHQAFAVFDVAIKTTGLARIVTLEVAFRAEPTILAFAFVAVTVVFVADARFAACTVLVALFAPFAGRAGLADAINLAAHAVASAVPALVLTTISKETGLAMLASAVLCAIVITVLGAVFSARIAGLLWWATVALARLAIADVNSCVRHDAANVLVVGAHAG